MSGTPSSGSDAIPGSVPGSTFVYVTYIRTSPERLWAALTTPEFAAQYWMGMRLESAWTAGAPWRLVRPDGTVTDVGEVIEIDPPRRLTLRWRNELVPDLTAEGYSRCTMEVEPAGNAAADQGDAVKLTVTHTMEREGTRFIAAVAGGWPQILSNLKSLLETGAPVMTARAPARTTAAA